MSNVYYRILLDRNNKVIVVCMQDFDEPDYDQKSFLTPEKFETEELGDDWIAQNLSFCREVVKSTKEFGVPMAASLARNRSSFW